MIPWQYFFSFNGRVTRAQYWLDYQLSFFAVVFVTAWLLDDVPADSGWNLAWIPWGVVVAWFSLAMSVKRWHDRDKSGWWILINTIPFFGNLWALVELGFLRGTKGPNRFGPDPLDRASADAPEAAADFGSPFFLKWRVVGVRIMLAGLAVLAAVTQPDPASVAEARAEDSEESGCSEDLGIVTFQTYTRSGAWDGSCSSRSYPNGEYARYFRFEVEQTAAVTIDLTSPSVDTWLALRDAAGFLEDNDDGGDALNARIARVLKPGTYTIEATTVGARVTGHFTLSVMVAMVQLVPAGGG